jgi:hypothetical protein
MKQEKEDAKYFGGRTTPASGATDWSKGDVKVPFFLIEDKFTDKDYYVLKLSIWQKIENEAMQENLRIPLLRLDICGQRFVIFDEDYFDDIADTEMEYTIRVSTNSKSIRLKYDEKMHEDYVTFVTFETRKGAKTLTIMERENFVGQFGTTVVK